MIKRVKVGKYNFCVHLSDGTCVFCEKRSEAVAVLADAR